MNGIQTTICGNLTADPELKYGAGGGAMLTFSIATERSWRNKDGEWENEVSYPDCIAWRNTAEDAANVLGKGMRVVCTGRFEQRFWEDKESGQRRNKWQFVIDEIAVSTRVIESLERKRRDPQGQGGQTSQPARKPQAATSEAW
jgi:single-strand DNA-binding protein